MVSLELLSVTDISNELVTEKLNGLTPSWIISKRPKSRRTVSPKPRQMGIEGAKLAVREHSTLTFPRAPAQGP